MKLPALRLPAFLLLALCALLAHGPALGQESAGIPPPQGVATGDAPSPMGSAAEVVPEGVVQGGSNTSAIVLNAGILLFILLYGLHAWFVVAKKRRIMREDDQFRLFAAKTQAEEIWTFVLVTCLLPLGITIIAVASDSISTSAVLHAVAGHDSAANGSGSSPAPHIAFMTWGFSKSVFVLMITLEISYLYNSSSVTWRAMLTSALVLDILAFLLFTALLQEDNRNESSKAASTVIFMAVVGLVSFVSSFLTVFNTRNHELYYSRRHGLQPPNEMVGAEPIGMTTPSSPA